MQGRCSGITTILASSVATSGDLRSRISIGILRIRDFAESRLSTQRLEVSMRTKAIFRALLIVGLAASAYPKPIEPTYRAPVGPARPFKGRIVGQFESTPTSSAGIFDSIAHASGIGTQVGPFSKVTSDTLNTVTGQVTGNFTMTTASGDEVKGHYSGYVVPGASTFYWVLNATITGGSGRFGAATGEFVFYAEGDYYIENGNIYGQYTESFEGTIAY